MQSLEASSELEPKLDTKFNMFYLLGPFGMKNTVITLTRLPSGTCRPRDPRSCRRQPLVRCFALPREVYYNPARCGFFTQSHTDYEATEKKRLDGEMVGDYDYDCEDFTI